MSEFLSKTRRLAALVPIIALTASEQLQVDVGRTFAIEFIDELRSGRASDDLLMFAISGAGSSGGEVLRGFLMELSDAVKEGAR